ncbi:MAG: glycosyltransferase, partial [Pseudomonadota bacterium]
ARWYVMGITELRQMGPQGAEFAPAPGALDTELVARGLISVKDAALARHVARNCDTSIDRILLAEKLVSETDILEAHARILGTRSVSEEDINSFSHFPVEIAPQTLMQLSFLPVTDRDGSPALLTGDPNRLDEAFAFMPQALKWFRILVGHRDLVQARVAELHREALTETACARVPPLESCRTWAANHGRRLAVVALSICALATISMLYPLMVLLVLAAWAAFTLIVTAMLKTAAFITRLAEADASEEKPPQEQSAPLPRVSVLVPMFRETEVAHALIARLTQLTYPKCLLDVLLVLEEEDELTRRTLAQIDLPSWIRVVVVPDGQPRTKPRAMNYALDFCTGDIVGIYDAEDAPGPDQITRIARRFQQVPDDVVCLQGILDYYNPDQNWFSRCFTMEYAAWFRLLMPGMARLGFAIPLGGTTLFFRRSALEELGGWDAHNVTEDADLGFRLARHGFRTEMIETVTDEEANCRPWAWIKQRSRWLKGYMTTYLVHMKQPRLLYRQLGAWKFWGFQAHFVAAVSQVLLAPVLLSFWLVFLGQSHPLEAVLPRAFIVGLAALFLTIEVINMTIFAVAVWGQKHRHLMPWVPTMHFYLPLGAIAAYKALYELVVNPFFWDKTKHGLSLATVPPPIRRTETDGLLGDGADFP